MTATTAPTQTGVRTLSNYVDGHWVSPRSDRELDVLNPATQTPLARVPLSSREDLEEAVTEAAEECPGECIFIES